MLITANIAKANDLYFYLYKKNTFCGINHLVAILVGAFNMNGCAIAHRN